MATKKRKLGINEFVPSELLTSELGRTGGDETLALGNIAERRSMARQGVGLGQTKSFFGGPQQPPTPEESLQPGLGTRTIGFSEDEVRRAAEERFNQQRIAFGRQIGDQFEMAKEREEKRLGSELSRLEGERGELGSLGLGSAELGVISAVKDASDQRIKDLERTATQAKRDLNMDLFNQKQAEISNEIKLQREREQTIFDRLLAVRGEERAEEQFEFQKEQFKQNIQQQRFTNAVDKYRMQLEIPEGESITLDDGSIIVGLKPENVATAKDIFDAYGTELISLGVTPDTPLEDAIALLQPILKQRVDTQSRKDLLSLESIEADIRNKRASAYKSNLEAQKLAGEITPSEADGELAKVQLDLLNKTMDKIVSPEGVDGDDLYKFAGKGEFTEFIARGLTGDTPNRRLGIQIDTIKSNLLTLATDPNIKKFFGPQMSEADVRMMTSAASSLSADSSPRDVKTEIERIRPIVNKLLGASETTTTYTPGTIVEVDGVRYRVGEDGDTLNPI